MENTILLKLEQADEILSLELNHYVVRPRKVKEARDLIQQALDEFEALVRTQPNLLASSFEVNGAVDSEETESTRTGEVLREQLE